MSITLQQVDQILASAMGSFPTVYCAVTVEYSRMLSFPSEVLQPQVSSKTVREDGKTDYVGYVVIPHDQTSVYLSMRKWNASVIVFPKQPVRFSFLHGSVECNRTGGASLSVHDRAGGDQRRYIQGVKIHRLVNDIEHDQYVPFYFRTGLRGEAISKRADMTKGDAHVYAQVGLAGIPPVIDDYIDESTLYHEAGWLHEDQRVYTMRTYDGIDKYSLKLSSGAKLAEIQVEGALSWRIANVQMSNDTCIRVFLQGSEPSVVITDIRVLAGVKAVRILISPVMGDNNDCLTTFDPMHSYGGLDQTRAKLREADDNELAEAVGRGWYDSSDE